MTHYTKTIHSDKTICDKLVFEVLRIGDDVVPILHKIDCSNCIAELENIIRKLKNGA